jgi:hypothetical protein
MKAVVTETDAEIDRHPIEEHRDSQIAPAKAKECGDGAQVNDDQHNGGDGVYIATIVFVSFWKGILVDHC